MHIYWRRKYYYMNELERNINLIKEIANYCDEITEARKIFGDSYETLINNNHYRNDVSMCILQIGELSNRLTEKFKKKYDKIAWRDIKDMRNIAAHDYKKLKYKILWKTISEDIPELCEYCDKIIVEYEN